MPEEKSNYEESRRRNRKTESREPNGMGRTDEQHPQPSRRGRPERPDLQLNTRKDIASASENEADAIFLFIFQKYVPFWTSNVPVTVVEQQFRKWGLYFQDKCCGIGVEDSSFPVLRFAQKNLRYRFKETFLKSVTVFASKTCGREMRDLFLKKCFRFLLENVR